MRAPVNCHGVSLLLSSGGYEDAGWLYGTLTRMHLALCPHCRRYRLQLELIAAGVRLRRAHRAAPERIEALQRRLLRLFAGDGGRGA